MSQDAAARQRTSLRFEADTYTPRRFNPSTRERFLRSRRQSHLGRIAGTPSASQVQMALTMSSLEYSALSAERENTLQSLREAHEHRRLLLRVLTDFERSLVPKPISAAAQRAEMAEFNARRVLAAREVAGD
jgi:hypothetical protein